MLSVIRWSFLVACCLAWSGCWPSSPVPLDEQKESNFTTGKARCQDRDFDGAIEAFEKAIEVNPHSASAHFELALIYDQQKSDYATALYHYEKARRLRPNAYPADIARDRLEVCKRELAKTVTQTPTMEYMQREIDRLMLENQRLRQVVQEWQNYYHGRSTAMPSAGSNLITAPIQRLSATGSLLQPERTELTRSNPGNDSGTQNSSASRVPALTGRTHKVASGETLAKIAGRYGVKLESLRAANPGLNERKLRVGQTLTIPAQ